MLEGKVVWSGVITAVQPRIRLTRSFDERSHAYLGYLLRIQGSIDMRPTVSFESASVQELTPSTNFESAIRWRELDFEQGIHSSKPLMSTESASSRSCAEVMTQIPLPHGTECPRRCQSIGSGDIGAWPRQRTNRNAKVACGVAPCRSRSSWTIGIRNDDGIGPKPFVTDPFRVLYIGQGQRARFRAGMEWSTKSLTG